LDMIKQDIGEIKSLLRELLNGSEWYWIENYQ
jgi:hypothetical protein